MKNLQVKIQFIMKKYILFVYLLMMLPLASFSQSLVHYWNFNSTTSFSSHITPNVSNVSGAALDTLKFTGGSSLVDYLNGTGQGFDVNNYNARNSDIAGNHLRFNNPIYGALVFSLPTTGYKDVVVKYAGMRSGSGAYYQFIYYTTDGSNYTLFDTIEPQTTPSLYTLDFSSINSVNNNANFKIRISFGQGGGGTAGNNRIDNFTLDANSISGGDVIKPTMVFDPKDNDINVSTNKVLSITFNEDVRLTNNTALDNSNVDACVVLKLTNASGADVSFDATVNGRVISITPSSSLMNNVQYYLALKSNVIEDLSNNSIDSVYASSFKTIALQTVFSPGDIVPIAYRMNALSTDDEVSFLTLVNILPGTLINFTDAKFTDNAQAQCAGGLTWTAPSNGVAAGTVIALKNDVPSVNIGTLTGSAFGLSSGGDQMIVYTGSPQSASHITALSSNQWLISNTTCSGSNSKLPSNLTDAVSSIQLSTANGNVSGNTANAFYNGPMNLPLSQIKDSILQVKYWVGAASGTNPQTWPSWAFDGPPVVQTVKVLTNNSIQIIFNKHLDVSSASNSANYTGISGLSSVNVSNNGSLKDTVVLVYTNPFVNNTNYSLTISKVKDFQQIEMFSDYVFNFSYVTKIAFSSNFTVAKEEAASVNLKFNITNPSSSSVELKVKGNGFSTATQNVDYTLADQTLSIGGTTTEININIPISNDTEKEQDEYFTIELLNPNGVAIDGKTFATIYIKDNDKLAPVANKEIELNYIKSFKPDSTGSTCEIVAYDSISRRIFTTSAIERRLDISDISNPSNIKLVKSIDMAVYGGVTSVAVKNGYVAVASPNANEQLNGKVIFFSSNGDFIKEVTVGALPDMITFTPDGKKVLTANEGQPSADYSVDPEGSVSIIDLTGGISNLTQSNVTTLLFTNYNSQETTLMNSGVRKLKSSSTLSQDFEPEYIAISPDSKKAWITLQENNAIAELNLETLAYTSVWALGTKDWSAAGNGFDASDNNQNVLIASWPVKSYYIPDAVVNFVHQGVNYILTANEGDEKEYSNLNERTTVGATTYKLDSAKFPNAAMLKETFNLGRLRVTNLNGDTDNDGDFDQIYTVGTRSFSIFNADTKSIVYDSKDDIEQITSKDTAYSQLFNADNEGNALKNRSRAKGPEPEGACVAVINKKRYAFVGLERIGGVVVYNINDPSAPTFVDYKNSRSKTSFSGDHGPEGIIFINDKQSPDGKSYILVANEISGTVAVYQVKVNTSVSIENVEANETNIVYPNPSSGNSVSFKQEITAVVIDASGKTVGSVNGNSFDTSELSNGVYMVVCNNGKTFNFIVSK